MSTAALFLAAKVEEQPRKLEHMAKVFHSLHNREGSDLDVSSPVSGSNLNNYGTARFYRWNVFIVNGGYSDWSYEIVYVCTVDGNGVGGCLSKKNLLYKSFIENLQISGIIIQYMYMQLWCQPTVPMVIYILIVCICYDVC